MDCVYVVRYRIQVPGNGLELMNKIMFSLPYDAMDVVKEIIEGRESSEWVDSSGLTGGHPKNYTVTIADVIEFISDQLNEEMEVQGADMDFWGWVVTDENGNYLYQDDETPLTDAHGNFVITPVDNFPGKSSGKG